MVAAVLLPVLEHSPLTELDIVLKSEVSVLSVSSTVLVAAFRVLVMLAILRPASVRLPLFRPVVEEIRATSEPEALSKVLVALANVSHALSRLVALLSRAVKPVTPVPKAPSRLPVLGPDSRLVSEDVTLSLVEATAPVNAAPTLVVILLAFLPSRPGVSVPPPLPWQQASLVRRMLLEKKATTLPSNDPGTMTVVQHPLDCVFLMVLVPDATA